MKRWDKAMEAFGHAIRLYKAGDFTQALQAAADAYNHAPECETLRVLHDIIEADEARA